MSYLEIPSGKVGDSSLGGIFVHAVDGEKICISQSQMVNIRNLLQYPIPKLNS